VQQMLLARVRFAFFVSLFMYFGNLFPLTSVSLVVSETQASVTRVSKFGYSKRLLLLSFSCTRILTHGVAVLLLFVLRFAFFVSLCMYFGNLFPLTSVSLVMSETQASVTRVSKFGYSRRLVALAFI
jgi:hypothetical protein